MAKKFYIETYGCQMNVADSEVVAAIMETTGAQMTDRWEDADIVLLGVIYVITILLYLFFNAVVVNYRPVMLEDAMEASFPSSHTVLAIVVFATAIIQVRRRLPEGQTKQIVIYVFYALLVILIVGRILSGVHWFTDICGGVLLGFALTYLYQGLLESFEGSSGKHAK